MFQELCIIANSRQCSFDKCFHTKNLTMASLSARFLLLVTQVFTSVSTTLSATVIEDLMNLKPPPDFNSTISINCINNPSLRYCSSFPMELNEIFKSTIVASHLCNESKNPNCVESFPRIDLRNRPKIAPLYLSYDFFWKYCPLSILSIDLANNSLKGSFPSDVLRCAQIHALDLSFNSFTGDLPINSFSPLTNLTSLNLSYNHFSESEVSESQFFKRFNASSFLDSGLLVSHRTYKVKAMLLLVGFPTFVILMVGCFGWLCFRRPDYLPRVLQQKHKFTKAMLKAATDGLSKRNLVVKSDGVYMYRGNLRDDTEVGIEIYHDNISRESCKKFVEDCKVLAQLNHKNLVQVLGWCSDRNFRAIVTKWSERQNVEMWLSASAPPWNRRLKVLKGVVEGMCYLNEQWPEVGYDLRTRSILLSDDLEPQISRFKIEAQIGINKKVYKLGVLLLEMIANRRPHEEFAKGEAGFIEYIRMNYPANLNDVMDTRLRISDNAFDQAKQGVGLGLLCTDQSASKYPNLNQLCNIIRKAYQTSLVLATQNHISHGGKAHKRVPSR
ncbi:hypothetical protein K2173_001806 [Erythroxylum novogranatense]|uniref:Protein kinase domain-containing protein n=1 Tax=Erythroxylum novogranatense TaxID=1862640 RepID=A0AAV8SJH0_9ROSI|nr:hypothetical protein K2173_001806 [Erythroxylum novogranatense]